MPPLILVRWCLTSASGSVSRPEPHSEIDGGAYAGGGVAGSEEASSWTAVDGLGIGLQRSEGWPCDLHETAVADRSGRSRTDSSCSITDMS